MIGRNKKSRRIVELEQLVDELVVVNEAMAEVVRRCPPRTVAVGRDRDAVLRQHEHLKSRRLTMHDVVA